MAKINVHVWHGVTGEIMAVGQPMHGAKCIPLSGENESVLTAEIDERDVAKLRETHRVDPERKILVKRSKPNT